MPKSKVVTSILKIIIRLLPYLVVAVVGIPIAGMASIEISKLMGLRTIPVPVAGTGSMYPSLFWSKEEGGPEDENKKVVEEYRTTPHLYLRYDGITLFNHTFFKRSIGYGDMVAFKNEKTIEILKNQDKDSSAGFIKRVIGLPGDIVELRDGFVYKNNELISEPYISSPRSTYGGEGIKDCSRIVIPANSYLVLGDNRKVSSDSRSELGLIHEADILYILPYNEQQIYKSLWRDTAKDNELVGQPTLSASEFIGLVNEVRAARGIAKLKLAHGLASSSVVRGEKLLSDPQTSYGMKQSIAAAGYSNIILGEFVSYGHFSAKELLENLLFNPSTTKQILSKDFSDIGVSDISRDIDGCPTQIIVGHLGGYIPATYDSVTMDSWQSLKDNLLTILPSWESARSYNNIDQDKLSSLLVIIKRRLSLAEEVVSVMEKRAWLSDDQVSRIKNDDADAKNAETLSKELNKE